MSLKVRIPHLLAIERPHDRHNGKAVQQNLGDYDRTGEDSRMKRYQLRKADVVLARDFSIGRAFQHNLTKSVRTVGSTPICRSSFCRKLPLRETFACVEHLEKQDSAKRPGSCILGSLELA
jgi:hypothetical protein